MKKIILFIIFSTLLILTLSLRYGSANENHWEDVGSNLDGSTFQYNKTTGEYRGLIAPVPTPTPPIKK